MNIDQVTIRADVSLDVVLTTVTDVVGIIAFPGLATLVLG
jgi:Mg/Co/Ni transporter MgtE